MHTPENIYKYLNNDVFRIDVQESVSSTNQLLKEAARCGSPEFSVLIASQQTNGRGRMGRSFFSPSHSGIYMSILVRPVMPAQKALFLTTSAAVACAKAIEKVCGEAAFIKWVNDIYLHDKKVCGILTESEVDIKSGMLSWAVVGIGINVYPPDNDFPSDIIGKAGSVFSEKSEKDLRALLAAEVLNEFYKLYPPENPAAFIEEYQSRSYITGKAINILKNESSIPAYAIGIDDSFNLIARLSDGSITTIGCGDVSIRL